MGDIDRRTFVAAGAAALAAPRLALAQSADVDAIVIGAGAAGIAAARRLVAAGRRCVVFEATDRVGGRCITDSTTFGTPYDRGAHAIQRPDLSPFPGLAAKSGLQVYSAPTGQKLRIEKRYAREGEMEDFLASLVRANRAVADAASRSPRDLSAAQALPKDLAEWLATVEFLLGPFGCGKNLDEVSAQDLARSTERDNVAYCREGYGTLLAKLADGLPVRLSSPVTRLSTWRGRVTAETGKGAVQGRAAIVTASTAVLASGKIAFEPALPKREAEALAKLTLGVYERVALDLPGNPLGLDADEIVFEKSRNARTAALLANVGGSSVSFVDIGGKFGRGVATQGPAALQDFAVEWLARLFGNDVKSAVRRANATQWLKQPWSLGAVASAPPGAQPLRQALAEPVRDRVWFAGEAVHETLWGTVGGAWESGERAANAALRLLGGGARQQ